MDIDPIKYSILDVNYLLDDFQKKEKKYISSNSYTADLFKKDNLNLILKENGKYFLSNYCLIEFFKILITPLIFSNLTGSLYINILSPAISVNEYENKHKSIYDGYSVNSVLSSVGSGLRRPLEKPLNFFSGSISINGMNGYKFWQFTDWRVDDGLNIQRGVDRFIYIPNMGIVAGSFDYWFRSLVNDKLIFENTDNANVLSKFLDFTKEANLGVTIFETNANLDSFTKLEKQSNGVISRIPCN